MAIHYSGNLLVKVRQRPFAGLLRGRQRLAIRGYRLEPLFKAHHATPMFSAAQLADHWLTATANAGHDLHPWDEAHRVARGAQYSIYAEPDLLQEAWRLPRLPRNKDLTRIGHPQLWSARHGIWRTALPGSKRCAALRPATASALPISIPVIGRRKTRRPRHIGATSTTIFTRIIPTRPTRTPAASWAPPATVRQPWRSSPATPST